MSFSGNGGQILVESLLQADAKVVFGVPGDTGVVFYDALLARRDAIRHVLAGDERGAAFMADVYARSTNRPGIVEVSSGGGVTFVVGGVGEALAASVPMILIASDIQSTSQGSGAITEIDQVQLFAAVTKHQQVVSRAADIPAAVAAAFATAVSGRPGPVALIFPEDALEQHATVEIEPIASQLPLVRDRAEDAALARAVAALSAAQRPAIVAGSGVHLSSAWAELTALAEKAAVPVATTIHGKGAIGERHPLSLGIVGSNGARPYANEYLATADVVLFVGTRANSTDSNGYTSPPRSGPTVIQIDIDARRAGRNYPGSVALVGDARTILAELTRSVTPAKEDVARARAAQVLESRTAWHEDQRRRPAGYMMDPHEIVTALCELTGGRALAVGEPGTPTPYLSAYWEVAEAGRTVILPRGHGAMGYALAGAVGAAMARPGEPVLAFTTDGSLLMGCGALEQAHRLQLPITYLHFNNASLGWIKTLQHLYFGQRYYGVDIDRLDGVAIARGFGIEALRPTTVDEVVDAVRVAMRDRTPLFLDLVVAAEYEQMPPVAPWVAAAAGNTQRPIY